MKFSGCLIASDYDGTLYNSEGVITQQVRDKIAYFIANGGRFTVSTGRTIRGFHAYEPSYINAPVLLANGSTAYDYGDDKLCFMNPVGEEIFDALRDIANEFSDVSIEMYSYSESFVINKSEVSHHHFTAQSIIYAAVSDPSEAKPPWQKVMIFAGDKSAEVQQYIGQKWPEVHFLPTTGDYIEIMQQGVDKGTGLFRLADCLNIQHDKVFAVGDGFNDAEMLFAAKIGFVPKNGSPQALAAADMVVRSNDDGAVAHVIEILDEIF